MARGEELQNSEISPEKRRSPNSEEARGKLRNGIDLSLTLDWKNIGEVMWNVDDDFFESFEERILEVVKASPFTSLQEADRYIKFKCADKILAQIASAGPNHVLVLWKKVLKFRNGEDVLKAVLEGEIMKGDQDRDFFTKVLAIYQKKPSILKGKEANFVDLAIKLEPQWVREHYNIFGEFTKVSKEEVGKLAKERDRLDKIFERANNQQVSDLIDLAQQEPEKYFAYRERRGFEQHIFDPIALISFFDKWVGTVEKFIEENPILISKIYYLDMSSVLFGEEDGFGVRGRRKFVEFGLAINKFGLQDIFDLLNTIEDEDERERQLNNITGSADDLAKAYDIRFANNPEMLMKEISKFIGESDYPDAKLVDNFFPGWRGKMKKELNENKDKYKAETILNSYFVFLLADIPKEIYGNVAMANPDFVWGPAVKALRVLKNDVFLGNLLIAVARVEPKSFLNYLDNSIGGTFDFPNFDKIVEIIFSDEENAQVLSKLIYLKGDLKSLKDKYPNLFEIISRKIPNE